MDPALPARPWWRAAPLDAPRPPGGDNALPLRHLASLMVLYGHSYDLIRQSGAADLVARLLPGFKAGSLAVYLFFTLSGFLLMLSMQRHAGVLRYAWHRCLRILPAYWVMLALTLLVLGPIASRFPLSAYLTHPGTWDYLVENLVPLSFSWHLPGVFTANPVVGVVNGSLWSLGLELRWYVYLGLLLALGVVRRRWLFTAVALAFLAFAGWEWWTGKPDPLHYRALSATFVASALLAQWRHAVRLSWPLFAMMCAAAALAVQSRWFGPLATATILYGVLMLAYRLPALRWNPGRDYSYGLFLYGFPVQQALVAAWPSIPPIPLFCLATLLTGLLAMASWHWVERPVLGFKRRPPADRDGAAVPAELAYHTRSSGTW